MMTQNPHRKIILLELPCVAMRLCEEVVSMTDTLKAIDALVDGDDGTERCTWVGHSFGTIVVGWVVRYQPHLVDGVVMIDPVCFTLWDGELVRNFLYKQ